MSSTDLQRLFYRTANALVSPLEDFLSEVLRIAIIHDPDPLFRLLNELPDERWRAPSGRPMLDLAPKGRTRVLDVDTQQPLDAADDLEGGRLDIWVQLEGTDDQAQQIWIEAKVDAPLTPRKNGRTQLDVYLDHLGTAPPPAPVLLTLAREPSLDPRVTGLTWKELAEAVAGASDADRWWTDLVAFLRAEGIVPSPLPKDPGEASELMSVFKAANACLKDLGAGAPMTLWWRGLEDAVIDGARAFTAGPMTWGMDHADDRWAWFVSIANHGYPSVTVPIAEVLAVAQRSGFLAKGWTRIDRQKRKRTYLFEKRRPYVGGDPDLEIGDWFVQAFHDLNDTGMLEPHFRRVREKQAMNAARTHIE